LAAIFALPANWFLVLLALIFLGGSWEYSRLAGFAGSATGYLLPVIQAILFFVLFQSSGEWHNDILVYLSFMCAAWLLMFFRLSFYHPGAQVTNNYRFVSFVTALVSITTGWLAISWIHIQPEGPWLILLLLLIVWAADTGAYFAGKNFGKRKLAKHISPGKTQAGLVGGLIAAPVVALLASSMMPITTKEPFSIVLVSLVAALVSVGGDLMISLHKRTSCIKDSGDLLPGHGGILDRLDSLMAAAPFFALALLLSGT
jgi:phosphatidate cytidylyltransferase